MRRTPGAAYEFAAFPGSGLPCLRRRCTATGHVVSQVRLQLQTLVSSAEKGVHLPPKYRGPFQTVLKIMEEEGFRAPFKGLSPGLHRQFLFTGVRLGLYEHVKRLFHSGAVLLRRTCRQQSGAVPCSHLPHLLCRHRHCTPALQAM